MAALAPTLDLALDLDPLLADLTQAQAAQALPLLDLLEQLPLVLEALALMANRALTLLLNRKTNFAVRVSVSTVNWQATAWISAQPDLPLGSTKWRLKPALKLALPLRPLLFPPRKTKDPE
jgi:hypothetical protein